MLGRAAAMVGRAVSHWAVKAVGASPCIDIYDHISYSAARADGHNREADRTGPTTRTLCGRGDTGRGGPGWLSRGIY